MNITKEQIESLINFLRNYNLNEKDVDFIDKQKKRTKIKMLRKYLYDFYLQVRLLHLY